MNKDLIKQALAEDLNKTGDITSQAIFEDKKARYKLISKDRGLLCGQNYFSDVFYLVDKKCIVQFYFEDGEEIDYQDKIATVQGKIKSILTGERVALNFLSHLSGIASKTHLFVKETSGKARIRDTRKTIPGLREAQKYAVKCGGGQNHRMGLFDMVMIKDNHIDGAGSIKNAVAKVRKKWGSKFKIEVETRNLTEVKEAIKGKVDVIMLDNMSLPEMKKAIKIIANQSLTEASGNMTIDRIRKVSEIDLDFISIGALTHSVKAFDFSLLIE